MSAIGTHRCTSSKVECFMLCRCGMCGGVVCVEVWYVEVWYVWRCGMCGGVCRVCKCTIVE